MARNRTKVGFSLDAGDIRTLPEKDIKMILRAADELIDRAGRNMLVKMLKGSKDKKVLEYKLDECPAYGYYADLKLEEVSNRVDWMFKNGYLRTSYSGRLPMIAFTEEGWEIEKETYAEELFQQIKKDVKKNKPKTIYEMEQTNRQVITLILQKVAEKGDASFIPQLDLWKEKAVKKVKAEINAAERAISGPRKLAVLFPGIGYTCDKPLLYYSAKLAKSLGYRILPISYGELPKNPKGDIEKIRECLYIGTRKAKEELENINWSIYEDIVFISKSIGTIIACDYAGENDIKARQILFTPLEDTFDNAKGAMIAFHGTSDPWAETSVIKENCTEKDIPLYITENANHSLETGNIEEDIETLKQTMAVVKGFLEKA